MNVNFVLEFTKEELKTLLQGLRHAVYYTESSYREFPYLNPFFHQHETIVVLTGLFLADHEDLTSFLAERMYS